MCAYWKPHSIGDKTEIYLQFEEQKLCFKICYEGDSNRRAAIRTAHHEKLKKLAAEKGFSEIVKPDRFGAGTWMTIAIVKPENIFGPEIVDLNTIIQKLNRYQDLINDYVKNNINYNNLS